MPRAEVSALSGNWKALLISPNRTIMGELTPLLGQIAPNAAIFELQVYPARQVVAELGGQQGPNLCFLDLISDQDRALMLIAELLSMQPAMKIVVLLASKDPDVLLRAMRAGAAEFLVRPFDPEQLEHSLERIASLQLGATPDQDLGRIITVMPAKGACGATTVACNLAQHYKRAGFQRILLADLDPLTGTLSFLLKLRSQYSFLDALSRSQHIDADIWKGIVTTRNGMDILLAPDSVQEGLHELRDAASIIEFARTFYEVVVLDTGTVFGDWNLNIARASDDVLLVTTNELPSVQAAQRAITYLESNRVPRSRLRLILNRYNKEFGLGRDVIETALHCDVFHMLPADYEIINRALIEGKPVPAGSNFGKGLDQLGHQLLPAKKSTNSHKKTSALSTLFSLFGKG